MTGLEPLLAGIGQSGFSSTASSSASLLGGSISFAPYSLSPVTGSGNESGGALSVDSGLPGWVWVAAAVAAVFLLKGKK